MKSSWTSGVIKIGAAAGALVLLLLVVAQQNAIEARLIAQTEQLRQLSETTERLSKVALQPKQNNGTPSALAANPGCGHLGALHPEVPNFLRQRELHWPTPEATLGGELRRGWSRGDPKGFNWMIENAAELGELLLPYTDSGLASRNSWTDPNTWYGELACRIEVTDNFQEYTVYLRDDVVWHSPAVLNLENPRYAWLKGEHKLTAHDFVFTLDMLTNPQVENGFLKNSLQDLESWKALDDHTLVVRWKRSLYGSVSRTLGLSAIPEFLFAYSEDGERFPKETIGRQINRHWFNNRGIVGTGPYRMTKYVPGTSIELERNENYFDEKPAISRIRYVIFTDPNQTVLRLKAGELGFDYLLPGAFREQVLQWNAVPEAQRPKDNPFLDGSIRCETNFDTTYYYVGWNLRKPLFKDARVRTALTLALRRKELVQNVFSGLGRVAMGPFLPESGGLDPNVEALDFDLERARKLLAEAGWLDRNGDGILDQAIDGKQLDFEFTLLIYGNRPEFAALANIYKEDLQSLGIRMKVETAEWNLMQKKLEERSFDAHTGGWGVPWDSDPYQVWHSSQADVPKGSNRIGYKNAEVDRRIETLRVTFDESERQRIFRELHRLIYADQPYTFFYQRKQPYCWNKNLAGVQFAKSRPLADSRPWYLLNSQ